jgi:hypothetical protein
MASWLAAASRSSAYGKPVWEGFRRRTTGGDEVGVAAAEVGVGAIDVAWIVSAGGEAVASIPDGEGAPPAENSQAVRTRQNKNSRSLFGDIGGYFTI